MAYFNRLSHRISIGVHLLIITYNSCNGNDLLLQKYEYSKSGAIKAFIISMAALGFVQGVLIPGAVSLISSFELFFVNSIGLPF